MARVAQKTARKDYPPDIKKGDVYYKWTMGYRGPIMRSKTPPTRAQTEANENKATVYAAYDGFSPAADASAEDVASDIQNVIDELGTAASGFEERFEAMPEGLQGGDVGQNLEANKDACESAASELEDVKSSVEDQDNEEYWDHEEDGNKKTITLNIQNVMDAVTGTEPDFQ
jgi:hypothetical protein